MNDRHLASCLLNFREEQDLWALCDHTGLEVAGFQEEALD